MTFKILKVNHYQQLTKVLPTKLTIRPNLLILILRYIISVQIYTFPHEIPNITDTKPQNNKSRRMPSYHFLASFYITRRVATSDDERLWFNSHKKKFQHSYKPLRSSKRHSLLQKNLKFFKRNVPKRPQYLPYA